MDQKLLEQLAARAEERKRALMEVKPFSIGGQDLECKKLTGAQALEYYGAFSEAAGAAEMIGVCTELIYDSCPTLQNTDLHKMLGIKDPYDAVRRLLSVREIDNLGGQLMRWNDLIGTPVKAADGTQSTQAEETAKNS